MLSALSLIGAMGSYVPPVAFTPVVTPGLIGEPYMPIVNRCLVPALAAIVAGTLILVYANPVGQVAGSLTMITLVYRVIVALVAVLVLAELFSQPKLKLKINAGLVLIPLILRALMIA